MVEGSSSVCEDLGLNTNKQRVVFKCLQSPAFGRGRQKDQEFKVILVYMVLEASLGYMKPF